LDDRGNGEEYKRHHPAAEAFRERFIKSTERGVQGRRRSGLLLGCPNCLFRVQLRVP